MKVLYIFRLFRVKRVQKIRKRILFGEGCKKMSGLCGLFIFFKEKRSSFERGGASFEA